MGVSVGAKLLERDDGEGPFMGGLQHDGRGDARLERLFPAHCAEAPLVARLEAREIELRPRRREVVAVAARKFQELRRESHTDDVQAAVVLVGVTAAVAEEPR